MTEAGKYKSTKRFGPRYGRRMKERFGKIEAIQRAKQKCPFCSAIKVKRLAAGIWNCRKCNAKFAGKAYSVSKKIVVEEETPKTVEKPAAIKKEEENEKEVE